jgi:hypothetical protein
MVKFCGNVSTESTILVTGLVKRVKEPIKSASIKDFEIHIQKLFIEVKAEVPLPLQVEDAERPLPTDAAAEEEQEEGAERPLVSLNTRLNNRTIDLRAKINQSIFVIKGGVCALFQEFLSKKGFTLVHTPKIIGAASEGGANVFELKYFDRPAYLAQSPQFYKQMLIASRFQKVMEIGPVFRAENSNTARHLTEFTGLDLEMEFQENYHEVMGVLEDLMLFIFKELNARYKKETDLVRGVYHIEEFKLPESGKVPRIPFQEGIAMLRAAGEELGDYDDLTCVALTIFPVVSPADHHTELPRRSTSAVSSSRSTTRTFTLSTSSLSPSAPPTPCPRPRTPSSPTHTTCSCVGRKSAPVPSVSTTRRCSPTRCASTTPRSTPLPRAPRTTSTASASDARPTLVVASVSSVSFSSGWVCPTSGCAVCSPGIPRGFCRKRTEKDGLCVRRCNQKFTRRALVHTRLPPLFA